MGVCRDYGAWLELEEVEHRVLTEQRPRADKVDNRVGTHLLELDELRLHSVIVANDLTLCLRPHALTWAARGRAAATGRRRAVIRETYGSLPPSFVASETSVGCRRTTPRQQRVPVLISARGDRECRENS